MSISDYAAAIVKNEGIVECVLQTMKAVVESRTLIQL